MDSGRSLSALDDGSQSVGNPFAQHFQPLHGLGPELLSLGSPLPLGLGDFHAASLDPGLAFDGFSLVLKHLSLAAFSGPALQQLLCESPNLALLYVISGEVSLLVDQVHWTAQSGSCLVLPGGVCRWQSTRHSVVFLLLDWTTVADRLKVLLPGEPALRAALACRRRPRMMNGENHALEAAALVSLDRLLRLVSHVHSVNPALLFGLDFADQITSLVLLLAFPELFTQDLATASKLDAGGLNTAFDDLIAYIRSNLDQALNLTVLEQRSNYSRRTLQYAFRDRFGCTPSQWIRAQRLDLAYRLLSNPDPEASVASIAQACGYRSMSLFSIEFQQRFHCKPSLLLRGSKTKVQDRQP